MQLEKLESKTDSSVFATAIEELLRYDGPIHRQWRVATEDTEFEGKQIGKGQLVAAMLGAANRDPAQFPDPDRLDVTRHNVRHVGFGYGIHFCLLPLPALRAKSPSKLSFIGFRACAWPMRSQSGYRKSPFMASDLCPSLLTESRIIGREHFPEKTGSVGQGRIDTSHQTTVYRLRSHRFSNPRSTWP